MRNKKEMGQQELGEITTTLNNWNFNHNLFNDPNGNYNTLQRYNLAIEIKIPLPQNRPFKKM